MKMLSTLFIAALTTIAMACGGSSEAESAESQSEGTEMTSGEESFDEGTEEDAMGDDGDYADDEGADEGAEGDIDEEPLPE